MGQKSNQLKLYILIRNDMPVSDQAVQGGHAVAEWCKMWTNPGNDLRWYNGTLIYLSVKDMPALVIWQRKIEQKGLYNDYFVFYEPDMGGRMTAIACLTNTNIFAGLPMWIGLPKEEIPY